MSEAVILAVVSTIGQIVLAALVIYNNKITGKSVALVKEHGKIIEETKEAVVTLEKNTNSIKDELVRVTGQSEFAKGLKAGTDTAGADARAITEQDARLKAARQQGAADEHKRMNEHQE